MTYSDQWKALSSRIRGLMQAGQLDAHYLAVKSSDTFNRTKYLHEQIEGVVLTIKLFQKQFQELLPPEALTSIDKFLEKTGGLANTNTTDCQNMNQAKVWAVLVIFAAFEAEISFLLSDVQESIRTRSELAFYHLQRLIVVDEEFRKKWQDAFKAGEVACEKLGAVHLLLHGIWAFKVNAAGARTDLVFQEPAGDLTDAQRCVNGFILTEWKKASPGGNNVEKQFETARSQARRYAQGALAGSELTGYRYLVVVSEKHVRIPEDIRESEVVYRHFNIAVNPSTPSKS